MKALRNYAVLIILSILSLSCGNANDEGRSTPIDSTNVKGTAPATYGGDDPANVADTNRTNINDTGTTPANTTNTGNNSN